MHKNIKWANKELPGLSHDELNKITYRQLAAKETGDFNSKSGLLKRIAKSGGKAVGPVAHINLNESQTFESRSNAHKKKIPKEKVIEAIELFIFNKERAKYLGISQVTYRRIVKEYNLYVKESAGEKMMNNLSKEERIKLLKINQR